MTDRYIFRFIFNLTNGKSVTSRKMTQDEAQQFLVATFAAIQTRGIVALETGTFVNMHNCTDFSMLKNEQPYWNESIVNAALTMLSIMMKEGESSPISHVEHGDIEVVN